jgi:hypothetical protein
VERATALVSRAIRRPATVIENGAPPIAVSSASVKPRSASIRRIVGRSWTSLPAATGVWVVNTQCGRSRARRSGSSPPPKRLARRSSSPANTAWPSFQ